MPVYPTEEQEQITFTHYLELLKAQSKVVIYTATPNNLWTRSWSQKLKMKRLGQKPGYPDLTIVLPHALLFVELKRRGPHQVSPEQKDWIDALQHIPGVYAKVCIGAQSAIDFINEHLRPSPLAKGQDPVCE